MSECPYCDGRGWLPTLPHQDDAHCSRCESGKENREMLDRLQKKRDDEDYAAAIHKILARDLGQLPGQ